jgi:hypothetical protein
MLGQLLGQSPSQFSPASLTLFPHLGSQSLSLLLWQALGQQPSLEAQAVCVREFSQAALQVPAFFSSRSWQPIAGQLVGQLERGSQVSPDSLTPLLHITPQSMSLALLQPGGQQSSPDLQAVSFRSSTHWALQVPPFTSFRSWHSLAGQAVGQDISGSQVSPLSLMPLSQTAMQSASLPVWQPGGQQPSPGMQAVCSRSVTHSAVQVPGLMSFRI